jgi:ComF family protein
VGKLIRRPSPAYHLYHLAWSGLDWLYPPNCGGCGKAGVRWCEDCRQAAQRLPETVCERCGDILRTEGICAVCRECPPAFKAVRSWAVFAGPVREALHRLKYSRDVALGEALAWHLVELFAGLKWEVDCVTAVPISIARRAERGYNQATLLAVPFALASGLPYRSSALHKLRDTRSQVGLNRSARRENLLGAFAAEPKFVRGQSVLVIDDVATSGATMQACAVALLSAGARQVYGLTLAHAGQAPA